MRQTTLVLALGTVFVSSTHAETLPEYVGETIVVTPTRVAERGAVVIGDVTIITAADIAAAGQTSLLELLQAQPGIEITQEGGAGTNAVLRIRGGNSGHTLVLVDGLRVGSATVGTTPLESIGLEQIERIEILRGPASSLYGADAVAGVVQIFTRHGRGEPRLATSLGAGSQDLLQGRVSYGGQAGATSFSVGAGYSRTDGGFSAARPGIWGYHPDDDGDEKRSAHLNLEHAVNDRHRIGLGGMANRDTVDYDAGTADDIARNDVNSLSAWWKGRLSDAWASQLRVGLGQNHTENLSLGTSTGRFDTDQLQYLWQNDLYLPVGSLTASLERNEQKVDASTVYVRTRRSVNAAQLGYLGQWTAHTVQASLRHDDYSDFGGHTTGTAAYAYALTAAWRTSVSYGTSFKAPTFNDMYWPTEYGFGGNPDLKPERGRNLEASLRYQKGGSQAGVTAYRNRLSDLIVYVPSFPLSTMENVHRATLEGITLEGETGLAGVRIHASADWLRATDDETGKRLNYRARRHGTLDVSKALGRWELGATLVASGSRFADLANTVSLPGYARLDVRTRYRINPEWHVLMRVNNVLDADYQLVAGYNASFELVPAYNTPGINGLVALQYQPR
ncbi:MAG: TonB-dependent receptor [Thiobacillus sp.]|uniref:TonB-dependent receptor domain-containing protein n=1 Tax=Thiobacillus sp. TaxID=924 RepID=UPI002893C783|nr:TonB-dependent receptor [Thiobacillus sp.]MDT3705999.1 TonB-dependent receptor [Thiobacillus sp.]